jgi:hypothetical protein
MSAAVIASGAKQSRAEQEVWIASSPLASRNDDRYDSFFNFPCVAAMIAATSNVAAEMFSA